MGVEHPPASTRRKSFSMFVHKDDSPSFREAQMLVTYLSSSRQTTMMAPCAGAGSIHSSVMLFDGRRLMRSRPACAKMAASQYSLCSFLSLVLTLPLKLCIWCSG